jgi:hypothetical protein
MICLRCGYCCEHLAVAIVDNPDLPATEDNIIWHPGNGTPCKHIEGTAPPYTCAVHNKTWYPETPCYRHTQIETHKNTPCRMGVYQLKKLNISYTCNRLLPKESKVHCPYCNLELKFDVQELPDSFTVDCPCGALLICEDNTAKCFHKTLHETSPEWPEDGKGTEYIELK